MDDLDREIIRELSENARKPFMTIAKKLGVSTKTVIRRYDELKKNGTIVLCAIRVNLEKIGYIGTAHLLIKTEPGKSSAETINQLREKPHIFIATRTLGSHEAYAVLAFRDASDLWENVFKIRKMPEVLDVDVSFAIPGIENFPPKSSTINPS